MSPRATPVRPRAMFGLQKTFQKALFNLDDPTFCSVCLFERFSSEIRKISLGATRYSAVELFRFFSFLALLCLICYFSRRYQTNVLEAKLRIHVCSSCVSISCKNTVYTKSKKEIAHAKTADCCPINYIH